MIFFFPNLLWEEKLGSLASTRLLVEAVCPASGEQGENHLTQNLKRQSIWIIFRFHSKNWCLGRIDHFCSEEPRLSCGGQYVVG